ncbi:ATP-binding cassette sub-family G member 4 [Culex quinquefasciatus]|uniref:ATP-binding cassette sub-family G member 4 n=1 Tax=Culex quinquefasciatus TaxID=7176 RepID=B0XIA1_CULQU|nr:ATP-binding cassette sub-family G member 4 [Culex quinquefasciatus]|eukprot:XP_001869373.1 ATP-binding cassette sub-family G member 4 [Culex quinquefasciatus]
MYGHQSYINALDKKLLEGYQYSDVEVQQLREKTALIEHCILHQHRFNLKQPHIIDHSYKTSALPVLEMCHITTTSNTVNRRTDTDGLSCAYANCLSMKEILHKVNGKFPGSQLIAIMGPSGAGKSTLLDVLSGYRRTGVEGAVYVNGRIRNLNSFRRMTCYITQQDQLQTLLTVLENMRIAADLKLGAEISKHEKESIIEDILTVLGLYEHQYTITSRLSGGQKKRLSIALELINNPTIMFLDEPTTGLDSYSCNQVVDLLKQLAKQGRTIIATIHQPSAKLFQEFDQVYVLSSGECMYQGCTNSLVPFLQSVDMPCPVYHNPADYVIELACGEHGMEKIQTMVMEMGNGESTDWFGDKRKVLKLEQLRKKYPLKKIIEQNDNLHATSQWHQLEVLIKRGIIKAKRDATLTHLRIGVNISIAAMLGFLFIDAGNEGSRVLDNYNLLFSILMHHMMATMMLTVLTFPTEMGVLLKEHFNRWYSLKSYYLSVNLIDLPLSLFCCLLFTCIIYFMSGQPMELFRFGMFFTISFLIVLIAQSIGLTIGAWFNVVFWKDVYALTITFVLVRILCYLALRWKVIAVR